MKRTRNRICTTLVCLLWVLQSPLHACTTMLITKGATEDGSVIVSHSDDNDMMDQRIIYVPAADHAPGSSRPVYVDACAMGDFPEYNSFLYPRYVGNSRGPGYENPSLPQTKPIGFIPQVPHTYAYFDGNYGIMNEHQLMFGECTDGIKKQLPPEPGKTDILQFRACPGGAGTLHHRSGSHRPHRGAYRNLRLLRHRRNPPRGRHRRGVDYRDGPLPHRGRRALGGEKSS